jgi:hypothetical protein
LIFATYFDPHSKKSITKSNKNRSSPLFPTSKNSSRPFFPINHLDSYSR